MASPQKENGFTPIANEILDELQKFGDLTLREIKVILFILRRTYGFNRKESEMSISFISRGTGIQENHVSATLTFLVKKRLIFRKESNIVFNKNHDSWTPPDLGSAQDGGTPDSGVPLSQALTSPRIGGRTSPRIGGTIKKHLKKHKKETLNTATASPVAVTETLPVNEIFTAFQEKLNPTINYGNTTQRKAAEDLLKFMGKDKLLKTIDFIVTIRDDPYAPVITNPYQLKEKLAQLMSYHKKQSQKAPLIVEI